MRSGIGPSGYNSVGHDHPVELSRYCIQHREHFHLSTVQSAWVENQCFSCFPFRGLVRVTIKEEIEVVGMFQVAEQAGVVAVYPGNLVPVHFQIAERLMKSHTGRFHGTAKAGMVMVTISEHEMDR